MKKLIVVLLIIAVICTTSTVESAGAKYPLNLIIIWDGAQRAHLREMLGAGQLPNLARLIRRYGLGLVVIDSRKCRPRSGDGYRTATGPANSAIVTGLGYPGMANWRNIDPHPIPDGLTLFERLKGQGYATGLVSTKDLRFWPHIPLSNAKPEIDFWRVNNKEQAWALWRAKKFIRNVKHPFFLWLHNQQPDNLGHLYGENSPEYTEGLMKDDKQLRALLRFLKTRRIERRTLVVITTDHGFVENETHHRLCNAETKRLWLVVDKRPGILSCVTTQTDIRRCLQNRL